MAASAAGLPQVRRQQRSGHSRPVAHFAPGLPRLCRRRDEIRRVQSGLGISIMTTPRGVMTGRQARREGVGGEILCEVW